MIYLKLALSAAILVLQLYRKHLTCPCTHHPSLPYASVWEICRPITICSKRVNDEMKCKKEMRFVHRGAPFSSWDPGRLRWGMHGSFVFAESVCHVLAILVKGY